MKRFLSRALEHKWVSLASLFSGALILGGWIWASVELKGISQPLIIHFNDYIGINRTGGLLDLSWLGIFGLIAIVVNFLIALDLEERDWFWGKFTSLASIFLAALIFIGFVVIINVN